MSDGMYYSPPCLKVHQAACPQPDRMARRLVSILECLFPSRWPSGERFQTGSAEWCLLKPGVEAGRRLVVWVREVSCLSLRSLEEGYLAHCSLEQGYRLQGLQSCC